MHAFVFSMTIQKKMLYQKHLSLKDNAFFYPQNMNLRINLWFVGVNIDTTQEMM